MNFPTQLSSVLTNTSGARKFFPYLGKNGVWLNAGATHTHAGSIVAHLSENTPRNRRMRDLLNADLVAGDIEITKSNSPVMIRSGGTTPYILTIDESGQNDVVDVTTFNPSA